MLRQANLGLLGAADVEPFAAFASQDVNGGHNVKLVDLVGIEPTTSPARPGRAQLCFIEAFINS